MHDHLRRVSIGSDADTSSPATGTVGRRTLTAGYIQRKERDGNGVAAGADDAVARAGSSSGAALPAELRDRFESSLGADLSGVRVHTGGDSAAAANAVGAKAYTLGNDIHFGAGYWDPASTAGQVLIAHEVAHTVQQAGGAQRAQYKLEVSTPGDASEVEADRAADAMVTGAPAAVSGGASLARQVIQRDEAACDPANASCASEGGEGGEEKKEEGVEGEGAMSFPKIGPFGIELGITSKGAMSIQGKLELKELGEAVIPICAGVYLQAKPAFEGSFQFTGDASKKKLTGTLGASVGATITLRGGLPHLASIGAGVEGKASVSISPSWSEDGGWSCSPLTFNLGGALVITGEIGTTEFKASTEPLQLVTLTIGESGAQLTAGPGVAALAEKLLASDDEAAKKANQSGGGAEGGSAEAPAPRNDGAGGAPGN